MAHITLKRARKAARLNQSALARKAGVGRRTVLRLEKGIGNPTHDTMKKLAKALGVEVALLRFPSNHSHGASA